MSYGDVSEDSRKASSRRKLAPGGFRKFRKKTLCS